MIADRLKTLYEISIGRTPEEITLLPGAGSNRKYYRLGNDPVLIGTYGSDKAENAAFIYLCRNFYGKGLPVPEVVAVSDDGECYLQTDLGNESLFDYIKCGRESGEWSEEIINTLERVMSILPDIQWRGAEGLDFRRCYPVAAIDRVNIMWDLNYFKYCFLKTTGIDIDEVVLERDFERLAAKILSMDSGDTFMYRDFQSRNVMLKGGNPYFIDFQGGRKGPIHYDVVAFLWQAKACYPDWLRDRLISTYIKSASRFSDIDEGRFRNELRYFVLFRTLQVLGAYGFRGYVERKSHFLQSIPAAIDNLRRLLNTSFEEYPYLNALLAGLVEMPAFIPRAKSDILTVKVASFGYKRHGIPMDDSGNGGGYVFDCRGLHNPGRYPEYKSLTGRDAEVIDFLEKDGGIIEFLNHAYAMVDNSVDTYLARGFTDLSVSFGCTGGQHRSVYSADHLAAHLVSKYPSIRVELTHFEQGIKESFEPVKS